MKTAVSIAQALRYLHAEVDPPFILSDLHSNAVYFTEDFVPKVNQSFRCIQYLVDMVSKYIC